MIYKKSFTTWKRTSDPEDVERDLLELNKAGHLKLRKGKLPRRDELIQILKAGDAGYLHKWEDSAA